jgi:peptidoglycan/LPS O-acetylase OafA/YrhL
MRSIISKTHAVLSFLTLLAVILQFFLAGLGVFGAEPYDAHRTNGYLVALAAVLLLALGLIGRLGRQRTMMSLVLVVLMIVQIGLIESDEPWVEAFHPLVALPILGVAFQLAMAGRAALAGGRDRTTQPESAGMQPSSTR